MAKKRELINKPLLVRQIALLFMDVIMLVMCAAVAVAMWYEFDFQSPGFLSTIDKVFTLMPLTIPCALLIFNLLDLYTSIWSFVGEQELARVIIACVSVAVEWWIFQKAFEREVSIGFVFFLFFLLLNLSS